MAFKYFSVFSKTVKSRYSANQGYDANSHYKRILTKKKERTDLSAIYF